MRLLDGAGRILVGDGFLRIFDLIGLRGRERGRDFRARYYVKCLARLFVWGVLLGLVVGCSGSGEGGTLGEGIDVGGGVGTPVVTLSPTMTVEPAAPSPLPLPSVTPLPEPGEFVLTPDSAGSSSLPTETPTPIPTETPSPTPPVTASPGVTATPRRLNGVLMSNVIVMPEVVRENVQEIFERGQELGRNPNAFSKVGDSTIEGSIFFARFDGADGQEAYNLGEFAYLERVIEHYGGSFGREGYALVRGLNTWSIFDPFWADDEDCLGGETVIECEFRLHNPSVVLIRLGANDRAPGLFDENLRLVVEYAIEQGVVPVLATRPDLSEDENDEINESIRAIAAEYDVPMWELDKVLATLPGRGVSVDGVHLTAFYSYDYTDELAFERGNAIQNLTGLIALDSVLMLLRMRCGCL
jgi:hypothetical protein